MIVDPDFLDHWRTGMVVAALADDRAPFYILRIWGHCQHRKKDRFEGMPAEGLRALCRFNGDAAALEKALIDGKFIKREGDDVIVLDWAEKNASLLAAWENGAKGGRPPKPKENPRVPEQEPNGNPDETGSKPIEIESRNNSSSLRSEEKARKRAPPAPPSISVVILVEAGFSQSLAEGFIAHKDRLKAPLTELAWRDHQREAGKAGWSLIDAAEKAMAMNWKAFQAKYVADERPPARASPSFRERERQAAEAAADAWGGPELAAFRRKTTVAEVIDVSPKRLG